jgi:hypothetical protein
MDLDLGELGTVVLPVKEFGRFADTLAWLIEAGWSPGPAEIAYPAIRSALEQARDDIARIEAHLDGLVGHTVADDLQLYRFFRPEDTPDAP